MSYRAPVADMAFTLEHAAGLGRAREEGLLEDLARDDVEAILDEAAKFATDIIAPLNRAGDLHGTPFLSAWCAPERGDFQCYVQSSALRRSS